MRPNVEVTGAARLHRAASRERSERGRPPGYVSSPITREMLDAGMTAHAQWWDELTYRPWPPDERVVIAVYTAMERARLCLETQELQGKHSDCL